jgi:hypothetical protein
MAGKRRLNGGGVQSNCAGFRLALPTTPSYISCSTTTAAGAQQAGSGHQGVRAAAGRTDSRKGPLGKKGLFFLGEPPRIQPHPMPDMPEGCGVGSGHQGVRAAAGRTDSRKGPLGEKGLFFLGEPPRIQPHPMPDMPEGCGVAKGLPPAGSPKDYQRSAARQPAIQSAALRARPLSPDSPRKIFQIFRSGIGGQCTAYTGLSVLRTLIFFTGVGARRGLESTPTPQKSRL